MKKRVIQVVLVVVAILIVNYVAVGEESIIHETIIKTRISHTYRENTSFSIFIYFY